MSERNRDFDEYGDGFGGNRQRDKSRYESRYGDYFDEDVQADAPIKREREPRKKAEPVKPVKRRRVWTKLLCALLIILLLLTGGLALLVNNVVSSINYVELDEVYKENYQSPDGAELASHKDVFNIMLFGVDEDTSDYGRSDSMILLSIDKKHKKLKMTSFQRDTFVYVPDPDGDYHTKLTNAYSYGGVGLALRTIEANYMVKIDRYAAVNFETFKTIVDILGGVELELTDREILYINCQIAQNNQTEYLDAEEGKVLLNGQQALWHARNRGGDVINGVEFYEGTDWDRTERQRKFLEAVVSDMRGASVIELLKIAKSTAPHITTNLTKKELVSLLLSAPSYLGYSVEQCSMPEDGTWGYEENFAGQVIYVYDWEEAQSALKQFVYETE